MKYCAVFAILSITLISTTIIAQNKDQPTISRYYKHARNSRQGQPGVKIAIELIRDGVKSFVPATTVFKNGDKVKFYFEANFTAYVKVYNLGSSGLFKLLYPYNNDTPQFVSKGQICTIPVADHWFEFDETPGTEQLSFIFSSKPIGSKPTVNQDQPQFPKTQSDQQYIAELNSQALKNGKDFKLVENSRDNSSYGVATQVRLSKPIGIKINLHHN